MSRYTGRQGRGKARLVREQKQDEAEARNAVTPDERRRQYRLALTSAEVEQLEAALG